MAFTLFDMILRASQALGGVNESIATGGTTTTLVDSTQTYSNSRYTDDCKYGTVFVTYDAAGAGAAPEGEFSQITAFSESTGTYTGTFTVAPAAGDTYAWTAGEYPFYRMIGLANEALLRIGDVPLVDTTTLDTAEDTTEYACAVAWKRRPYRVDIQSNDSSANNKWVEAEGWDYIPATAGSTGLIVFPYEPTTGYDIRVHYIDSHPQVTTYSSVIREEIDPELAVLSLVAKALRWNCLRTGGSDKFKIQVWNQAEQEYLARSIMHPVPSYYAPRKGKLMIVRD